MSWLTKDDVDNYGPELINVTQRAALHAVSPHIQQPNQQNAQLQRQLAVEARRNLDQRVGHTVPNYREIDRDPRWHQYLLGVDALSGRRRQTLLNDAINSGDHNRIATIFRTFQQQAGAQPPQAHQAATRSTPFARSASGGRIYSRDDISKLYRRHQQGAYANRKSEWARQEADIIAAGREGRIRNPVDVNGK